MILAPHLRAETTWRVRVIKNPAAMQRFAKQWRRRGVRVGFVPTMGYLHAGHVSLIERARKLVGTKGVVVVSIYVNPTQFAPAEDLSSYPRDLARDRRLCRGAGVDVIFFPNDVGMYPGKAEDRYSTYVVEEKISRTMEGKSRPTHFRGVATVVAKLFNIVLPDVAVFGAKDFQQAAIIQRMVRDLNFPVKVVVAPTVREADGLAMSSRNKYLSPKQRGTATVLWRSILATRDGVRAAENTPPLWKLKREWARERKLHAKWGVGIYQMPNPRKCIPAGPLKAELKRFIENEPGTRVDYIEFVDPKTLEPVTEVRRGVRMVLAVFVGKTRLIDNQTL
jgi:pantoate--beta-alanine ligase